MQTRSRSIQSQGFPKKPSEKVREYEAAKAQKTAATRKALCTPSRAICSATMGGGTSGIAVEKGEYIRDKSYRRWVASLPCFECRIQGLSQAAHPNTGKGKGMKQADDECFPMCCDRPGVVGCHTKFDQYKLVPRAEMPAYEARALAWTRAFRTLAEKGLL